MKKWLALLIVVLVIGGGYLWKDKTAQSKEGLPDSSAPLKLVQENLGSKPVFLEFTSDSCTYCKQMKPLIKELADRYGDRVEFVIANTEKNQEAQSLAYFYQVRGVPTFVIHGQDGTISDTFIGLTDEAKLTEALEKVLK